ncbi:MAG: TAT-variant-translocated molybdopterin oxidoreductase [Opitutaceae bacterium]|nr:TAT-variant-translocated molybdopterin oxidoreductase [Opitutaceae bacterium]
MKPINSTPATKAEQTGPRYWRSLDELSHSPEFLEQAHREFGVEASEMNEVDRRHFFKIMAASFAIGGVGFTGCRRPESNILPHSKAPEYQVPGQPLYYATSFSLRGESLPLLVETHAGRPTKIEGNADYKAYNGGTSLKAQASVLELYDPDRSTRFTKEGANLSKEAVLDVVAGLKSSIASSKGKGVALLTEKSSSPTRLRLKKAFLKAYPQATWAEYEPVATDNGKAAASIVAGANLEPKYDLSNAERILCVAGDFLGDNPGAMGFSKQFADRRRVRSSKDKMNRLYVAESGFSTTGAMADHRKRLATSQMTAFLAAAALEIELGVEGDALKPIFQKLASGLDADTKEWISKSMADLAHFKGESLVYAGPQLSKEAHGIALLINEKLGNLGKTVSLVEVDADESASIEDLAAAIDSGSVDTLLISGGNPVYNAPVEIDFASKLSQVETVIRLGYYDDETSEKSNYHFVQAHYLESWGDGRTYSGDVLAQQPMILPLFEGISEIELLGSLVGETNTDGHSLVYATLQKAGAKGKSGFDQFLHDGFLSDSAYKAKRSLISGMRLAEALAGSAAIAVPTGKDNLEAVFVNDASVDDGRYINNGWLQECPDPMSKLTWDNAIFVSPRLANELDIVSADSMLQITRKNPNVVKDGRSYSPVATVTIDGREITGGVQILPGLDNYSIILPLGYGRTRTGRVGTNSGFSSYAVRTSESATFVSGAKLELTGEVIQLANTQEHWSMEGRAIVRESNLDDYASDPQWVEKMGMESHSPPILGDDKGMSVQQRSKETPRGGSLYKHPDYTGIHQWGMAIDLNVCSGCNACVVACQSENNIPIVGKDQVRRGREMHWIRMDRYFSSGDVNDLSVIPEDPQVSLQPIACMHCETAPCETVCPVNATVHDEDGLNTMAYNRCIGTRYCANNCPYKVRRFNFMDYQQRPLDRLYEGPLAPKGMPELVQMAQNPDVSVRMRGVMEKCTYCVQRIQQGKIAQKVKAQDSNDIRIPDGTIKVACQQVCPMNAIEFGDVSDEHSLVSELQANERNYAVLGYTNTRPRTTYLAKLRNQNPEMPDYIDQPHSTTEYEGDSPHHGGGHEPHESQDDHGHDEAHSDSHTEQGGAH